MHEFCLHICTTIKKERNISKQGTQRARFRAPSYNVPSFLKDWPGRRSCLFFDPKNTNVDRGRLVLASCQVLLNSFHLLQRS